jgi:hypothetical protein
MNGKCTLGGRAFQPKKAIEMMSEHGEPAVRDKSEKISSCQEEQLYHDVET